MLNILVKSDISRILLNFGWRELNHILVTLSTFVLYVITYILTEQTGKPEMSLIVNVCI